MENSYPIKSWNDDEKPREKLMNCGQASLSNAELLAILLGTGTRVSDGNGSTDPLSAVDLGKKIMDLGRQKLHNVARLGVRELMQEKGIGQAKAITVIAALELGNRRRAEESGDLPRITCSRDAYDILRLKVEDLQVEQFWVLMLNRSNRVLRAEKMSEGGINGTTVDCGIIFKKAILENAKGLVLCHNHPSGNVNPSESDIRVTRQIKAGGKLLEIQVIDHLIITSTSYTSLADQGLIRD